MSLFVGENGRLALGKETVAFGTSATRDHFFPLASTGSISVRQPSTPRPSVARATGGVAKGYFQGRKDVTASAELEMLYEGFGTILEAALGASATTGTGPYVHTYSLTDELPSYTGEVSRTGRQSGSSDADIATGLILNRMVIKGQANGLVTVQTEWLGQDMAARSSPTSATFSAGGLVEARHASFAWNSLTDEFKGFELSIDNGHAFRDRMGARTTARPTRISDRAISLKIMQDYQRDDFLDAMLAGTESNAVLTLTDGTSTIAITLHSARVNSESAPVSGLGIVSNPIEFLPRASGSNRGLSIVVTNSQSDATAA